MAKQPRQRTVSIIGVGNWGTSLAHALALNAVPPDKSVDDLIARKRKGISAHSRRLTSIKSANLEADILWLCVPDNAIATVTESLVQRASKSQTRLTGKIFIHSSGAHDLAVLQAAARAGASVASVHPMMSFPTRTPVSLQGVPFGIEADAPTRRSVSAIVRRIGGLPLSIASGHKALYHAAGMLSSPLLVSHLVAAQQAAVLAGFTPHQSRALLEPIVRATVDNVFLNGGGKSFSGPIARGDVETIRLHLHDLQTHPMLADVYRALALYALEKLPSGRRKELRRLLRSK